MIYGKRNTQIEEMTNALNTVYEIPIFVYYINT